MDSLGRSQFSLENLIALSPESLCEDQPGQIARPVLTIQAIHLARVISDITRRVL